MDGTIPVLDATTLVVFKAFFDRTKDWADIEAMVEAGALDGHDALGWLVDLLGGDDPRVERLRRTIDRSSVGRDAPPIHDSTRKFPDRAADGSGGPDRTWSAEGGGELVVVVGPPAAPAVVALAATGPVPQRDGVRVTGVDAAPDGCFDAVDGVVHGGEQLRPAVRSSP